MVVPCHCLTHSLDKILDPCCDLLGHIPGSTVALLMMAARGFSRREFKFGDSRGCTKLVLYLPHQLKGLSSDEPVSLAQ